MNSRFLWPLVALALAAGARAAITVPGANGSDGALNVTSDTTIDLSQAPTGKWDSSSPTPGNGVYDPDKWAVVFHYTSVNIAAGQQVSFKNNATRAPVVWLVSGDVTIDGTVNLRYDAQSGPGPGGFRGGQGGGGLGPGGAPLGGSAAYGSKGADPSGLPYGNTALMPLIGGSGGASGGGDVGAGAILIAATGRITINGTIAAYYTSSHSSGGAIRLVAASVQGTGSLQAQGPGGGDGRIRVEAPGGLASTITTNPTGTSTRNITTAVIFPPDTAPSVRIVQVGTEPISNDPQAQFGTGADASPDVIGTVPVVIETKNVPTTATVNLRVAPANGAPTLIKATLTSGDANLARWLAQVTPTEGTTAMQVRVEAQ